MPSRPPHKHLILYNTCACIHKSRRTRQSVYLRRHSAWWPEAQPHLAYFHATAHTVVQGEVLSRALANDTLIILQSVFDWEIGDRFREVVDKLHLF